MFAKLGLRLGLTALVLWHAPVAHAAVGDLDPSFDGDGRVVFSHLSPLDGAGAVVVQPDGNAIVGGGGFDGLAFAARFTLTRFAQDGSFDASFGTGGVVEENVPVPSGAAGAVDVVLQPDGRILVAVTDGAGASVVLRRLANGSPDASFATVGWVSLGATLASLGQLALQPDGKIVAVGTTPGSDAGVVRLNADGTPDGTFGTAGVTTFPVGSDDEQGRAVALQPDGAIIVGGGTEAAPASYDPFVARLLANGTLDGTFGSGGIVVTPLAYASAGTLQAFVNRVAVLSGGEIQAFAGTNATDEGFVLLRYLAGGGLDGSFGAGGIVAFGGAFGDDPQLVAGVVQPDGKLLSAGTATETGDDDRFFVVIRHDASGAPDPTFGTGGMSIVTFSGSFGAAASDSALAPDGNVYVSGTVLGVPAGGQQAAARLIGDSPLCPSPPDPGDDADSDGVHDACDNCPATANAGQEDADGDGAGDACDPCPADPEDTCDDPPCAAASKARLVIGKLHTPPGDDTLAFTGEATLPHPFSPPLDLVGAGLRLLVSDAADGTVLDVVLPGGAYDKDTKAGWKVNSKGTAWTYRSTLGVEGVTLATLRLVAKTPGKVKFRVTGKKGSYPVAGGLPLGAQIDFDPPSGGANGQCAEATFPGPSRPAPTCTTNAYATTVICR